MLTEKALTSNVNLKKKTFEESRKEFGAWLKRQIEVSGLNQNEVAAKVGLTSVQLSRIINGQSGTRRETIEVICDTIQADKFEAFRKLDLVPEKKPLTKQEEDHLNESEFATLYFEFYELPESQRREMEPLKQNIIDLFRDEIRRRKELLQKTEAK